MPEQKHYINIHQYNSTIDRLEDTEIFNEYWLKPYKISFKSDGYWTQDLIKSWVKKTEYFMSQEEMNDFIENDVLVIISNSNIQISSIIKYRLESIDISVWKNWSYSEFDSIQLT